MQKWNIPKWSQIHLGVTQKVWCIQLQAFWYPVSPSLKLDSNLNSKKVDVTLYRGTIGNLLYLIASRLDIMLSVRLCARYQANPKESHLLVIKHIMRYLIGTS